MYIPSLWLSCVKKISQDAPSLLRQELVLSAFQRAGAPERTTLGSIFGGDITDTWHVYIYIFIYAYVPTYIANTYKVHHIQW